MTTAEVNYYVVVFLVWQGPLGTLIASLGFFTFIEQGILTRIQSIRARLRYVWKPLTGGAPPYPPYPEGPRI